MAPLYKELQPVDAYTINCHIHFRIMIVNSSHYFISHLSVRMR